MKLKEYLKNNRLITDGAMETYYDALCEERGIKKQEIAEFDNILNPELIKEIHLNYIRSGARLIRTNTFAANTMYFAERDDIRDNIRCAVKIARQAVEESGVEEVFIGADIGSISDVYARDDGDLFDEYRFICDCFLEEGLDVFVFETQSEWRYVKRLADYVKSKADVYVIAQFSFDRTGYTRSGMGVQSMLCEGAEIDSVDSYGFNCGMSSSNMYQVLSKVKLYSNKEVTALPNASYPTVLRGKVVYSNNKQYFTEMMDKIDSLGIRILGGCCGTTPEYIQEISKMLEGKPLSQKKVETLSPDAEDTEKETDNDFVKKLKRGEKVFVVELDPPFDNKYQKVIDGARYLKGKGTDIITLADSPLARARTDCALLAAKLKREVNIPVMPHISCRDRNTIAIRGLLLGMHLNDLRNLLIVTGDPIPRFDQGAAKPVYDFNSIRLMNYVKQMNEEHFAEDKIYYGGALNYHGVNARAIVTRMKAKMDAGAKYFLTQPIYSQEDVERIKYLKQETGARIFGGIMPLVSYKNAQFIKNEMPGIEVPDEVIEQYKENLTREEYEEIAVKVSVEVAKKLTDVVDGYYFMTPFGRVELIQKIIDEIKKDLQQ